MEKNNRLREMLMAAAQGGKKKPEIKVEGAATGNAASENGPAINSEQSAAINTGGGNADGASLMLAAPQSVQVGPVSSPPNPSSRPVSSTASVGGSSRTSPAPSTGGLSDNRCWLLGCGS